MLLSNPQVKVDGDTATVKMFWTGVLNDKLDGPPHLQEHGREYDMLVKKDGKWLISKRVVVADSGMPAMFKATYTPRVDYDVTKDDDASVLTGGERDADRISQGRTGAQKGRPESRPSSFPSKGRFSRPKRPRLKRRPSW